VCRTEAISGQKKKVQFYASQLHSFVTFIHCYNKLILFSNKNLTNNTKKRELKVWKIGYKLSKNKNATYWSSDSTQITGSSESRSSARVTIEVRYPLEEGFAMPLARDEK
jgi:hypothetical protein